MYAQYDTTVIDEAKAIILENDRRLYDPFITALVDFVISHNIAVGGKIAAMLLTGTESLMDCYVWELYVDNAYAIGKQIAGALYAVKSPHVPAYTTALKTDVRDTELTIQVNSRPIVKLYSMRTYKSVNACSLMRQVYGKPDMLSRFTTTSEKIRCAPQELMLIDVYRLLYNPPFTPEVWSDNIHLERFLNDGLTTRDGSAPAKTLLMSGVIDKNCVVIGEHAIAALGISDYKSPRLQLITHLQIEELAQQIENVIKRKITEFEPGKITIVRQSLAIPIDFQLTKYSLYINRTEGNEFICDVYNSTSYELVPYISHKKYPGVKFGSPWVLLRFLYIEIWVLELIGGIRKDRSIIANKSKLLHTWAQKVRSTYNIGNTEGSFNPDLFPLTYDGVYLPLAVAKKKMGPVYTVYYPAAADMVVKKD